MKTKILKNIDLYFLLDTHYFCIYYPRCFNLVNLIDDFQSIEFLNLFRLTINSISVSLFTSIFVVLISILFYMVKDNRSQDILLYK